jgi:hypothetical protein
MSPATRTKRGRHHRGGGPVLPAPPDERDTASYAWRPSPLPAIALSIGALGIVIAQFWLEISHPVLAVFAAYPGCAKPLVLDDGPSDEAREASASYGFRYLRRPESRQFGKHGNLRYAFGRTTSPMLVVLDADCRPRHRCWCCGISLGVT